MSVGILITAGAAWAISGLATTTDPATAAAQLPNGTMLSGLGAAIYSLAALRWVIMLLPLAFIFFGWGALIAPGPRPQACSWASSPSPWRSASR